MAARRALAAERRQSVSALHEKHRYCRWFASVCRFRRWCLFVRRQKPQVEADLTFSVVGVMRMSEENPCPSHGIIQETTSGGTFERRSMTP